MLRASPPHRRKPLLHVLCVLLVAVLASTVTQFLPALRASASAAPTEPAQATPTGPAERPDLISAQLAARAEKRRIEITNDRTETTSTFVNPDGTITVESFSGVHRIRRGDGWVLVDTTLALVDGKVTPKAAKADVVLSAGGGKAGGDVARLADAGREVAFAWPTALPAPELKGNVATYKAVAKDTDLQVEVTPTGFDVQIVAHTPAAAQAALNLPMRLKGVTAERTAGGELRLSGGGKLAARSPTPLMWDAHVDEKTGLPDRTRTVDSALSGGGTATPTLALRPDKKWLTDPARQYPVTIDPAAVLPDNFDADVASAYPTTNYDTYQYLRVGAYLGSVQRSFLKFDTTAIEGRHVTAATLNLWQAGSTTCDDQPTIVQGSAGLSSGATWNTQPASDGTTWGSASFNEGADNSCGAGPANIDITSLVQAWSSNGQPSPETLTLRAANETLDAQFKSFYSGDTLLPPQISTTYNSYPGTVANRSTSPCSAQCGGSPATVLTNSTRPVLSGASTDADGAPLRLDFEVWNSAGTTKITDGSVSDVSPNATASWTVPASVLTNGTSYQWRSRAYDGVDYSQAWSGWIPFTVDTTAPSAPTSLTSAAWTSGGWSTTTSGTISWTSPGGDTASFLYGLDEPSPSTETTGTTTPTLTPGAGLHTLYVRTKDKSGNLSPVASFGFGIGTGALASPAENARVQRFVILEGQAPSTQVSVTYQYHLGTSSSATWLDVPVADTVIDGTSTHPTWPAARNGSGVFDRQNWNLPGTLGGGSDGPVQLRACFRTSANVVSCTAARTIEFTRNAFGDSNVNSQVGPGTLALLTGDYSLSATDVSMPTYTGSLAVGRSTTTLTPPSATSDPSGVFGPGWTSDLQGPETGAAGSTLTDTTSTTNTVSLTSSEGTPSAYSRTGSGSYPYSYVGVGDTATDGSKLVKDSATQFTHTGADGTKTVFVSKTVGSATIWVTDRVEEPGSATTSTYTTDSAGRVTRILGPVPDGVTCTTLVAGCRALTFTYATSTTATGTTPATWGDYTGRLASISMSLNGASAVVVAQYRYDNTGHLREQYDPRLDSGGTHLSTTYAYNAAGQVSSYTPPGQETWTFGYDTYNRITTVSRARPAGAGTATQTIVYGLALTGSGAPIDMAAGVVDDWGQRDLPSWATAVFPASRVPSNPPVAADWPYADITYLNVDGREVNSASYGNGAWQITTTEHDSNGNVIRELGAENRNQAVTSTADTDPTVTALTDSAARAQLLDTDTVYSTDGVSVTDTFGPTHRIVDDTGAQYSARQHVHTDYDEGAPSSTDPYRLPTTVTTTIRLANGSDTEPRKTINGYEAKSGAAADTSGWTLRTPTTIATWMGGGSTPNIVRATYYNNAGNPVETRQPAANAAGTDAYTSVVSYYTATGSGSCVNASWTGLTCTTGPAAQPTSGNPLPVTSYTYNNLNQPLTKVDTVTSGSTTTRTTTYTYDTAGRPASEAIAASPAANGGTAVPTATYGYSTTTGLLTTTTASSITLTTGYDTWGQATSQTDADSNTGTATYDIDGQVATLNDGKGTYTYVYDTATEHRGLVTSLGVGAGSAPSTFSATYDGEGRLAVYTYPNGLTNTTRYNNSGEPTSLVYAKSGTPWLTFSQASSISGEIRSDTTAAAGKSIGYDLAGRLTSVVDAVSYGGPRSCTTRVYTYDADYNRTAVNSYPDAGGQPDTGNCSTTTTPMILSNAYDQADRITDTGYTYDLFGRTTAVPAADAGGTALTVGYYVNDLVESQTSGSATRTYALDPARRIRSWTDGSTTSTNHYTTASGDSPAWIGVTGGTWTRNILGIGGDLAAVQNSAGAVTLQLANLHGDVVATVDDSTGATAIASYAESDEFGHAYFASTAYARYGWLGTQQRSRDSLGGLVIMGVRLYNPVTGRFLSKDPVVGGSANPYDYVNQDPYNSFDFSGTQPTDYKQCPLGLQCSVSRVIFWYNPWPSNWRRDWVGSIIWRFASKGFVKSREFQERRVTNTFRRYFYFNRRSQDVRLYYVEGRARVRLGVPIIPWSYPAPAFSSAWKLTGYWTAWV
ncbi:RHS repeat-associated core domain-containing protein [Parafrankia irregularis]|uniref:RHS repeat-associated core domain-containing protein n=1 Tax=Parafrankia irregularis TaxID=795642 RepID=A0A0S4QEY0_9ACTN|nr:RHS repeat-associated core domain-containing protein [Parafrankia irregularis]